MVNYGELHNYDVALVIKIMSSSSSEDVESDICGECCIMPSLVESKCCAQFVSISGFESTLKSILYGVPQGYILGPLISDTPK